MWSNKIKLSLPNTTSRNKICRLKSDNFKTKFVLTLQCTPSCFQLNGFEVRKGKSIAILPSLNNHRLFVGNIPKNRDREELFEEFTKHARKSTSSKRKARENAAAAVWSYRKPPPGWKQPIPFHFLEFLTSFKKMPSSYNGWKHPIPWIP